MTVERLLRQLWRRALRLVRGDARSRQLHDEVVFWRKWFSTRGSEWPDDYNERLDPNFPLQEHIAKYVDRLQTNIQTEDYARAAAPHNGLEWIPGAPSL